MRSWRYRPALGAARHRRPAGEALVLFEDRFAARHRLGQLARQRDGGVAIATSDPVAAVAWRQVPGVADGVRGLWAFVGNEVRHLRRRPVEDGDAGEFGRQLVRALGPPL